jgi:hypothetical protein
MLSFINDFKEMWEELSWQFSDDRKELAAKRLAAFKKHVNQEPGFLRNPYTDPEDYQFA